MMNASQVFAWEAFIVLVSFVYAITVRSRVRPPLRSVPDHSHQKSSRFSLVVRLRISAWSMYSSPLKWSVSCWKMRAGQPCQMFLMLVAVLILPTGGDVKPTLAYGLVTVEAQAAFVEAAGFGADRLVAGVDDGVEGEFRSFARIAIIAFAYVVFDDGQSQTETDLGGCRGPRPALPAWWCAWCR